VDAAYEYCRAITHKHGGNFSVGFRFLPAAKRRAVYAAYAFCRVADDIADEVDGWRLAVGGEHAEDTSRQPPTANRQLALDEGYEVGSRQSAVGSGEDESYGRPPTADRRLESLDAWQRELEAAYANEPTHPITIALADALQRFAIPKSAFIALIDGCRQDMVKTRYETFEELLQYCDLVATSISDISLSIFGYRSPAALDYGRNLSTALQLTNVTRDIGDDVTRDRIYIPATELRSFGVEERELKERVENERVRKLIEFQIARAERYFRDAEPLLRELDFDARFPTLLMGGVYATVLAKLRKDPLLAVRSRLSLSKLQKLLVIGTRVLRPHFV
jgi:15-cis-phytoene synthase